jgi:polysaccharide export outer membrane protein
MRTLPRYVIEPPDVVVIEALRLVPKRPYRVAPHDVLRVRVEGASPDQPIDDAYSVDADGTLNFGPTYGRVAVDSLTIDEIQQTIHDHLAKSLNEIDVSVSLQQSTDVASVSGQHLVAMDGRVNLGAYGSVFLAGLTVEEARRAIEKQLAEQLDRPQIALAVQAYNSKVYYIITAGGAAGDDVVRAPITGNETVLDAVANLGGIAQAAATKMWIARPAPNGAGVEQILTVAWDEIARGASTETNYQILPGDRLFIETEAPLAVQEHPVASPYASAARKAVQITVKTAEGATHKLEGETNDRTVGELLRNLRPIPVRGKDGIVSDLSSALITLSRDDGEPGSGSFVTYPIGWDSDEGKPIDGDRELLDGDRIELDFRKPEPGAVILPNPILPAPAAAPPTEARVPTKRQIEYSIAFIEDLDGDFAEFVGAAGDADVAVAIRDAATLEPALRVLERHNHIKRLADPQIVSELDRPAEFSTLIPAPVVDRMFRTQYRAKVVARLADADAVAPQYRIEFAAEADRDGKQLQIDFGFVFRTGQTAIARLVSYADRSASSPLYVVVTPRVRE